MKTNTTFRSVILLLFVFLSFSGKCEIKQGIAIQLYSVRDKIKSSGGGENIKPILQNLSKMGYTAVEAAGYKDGKFYGLTPVEFKKMVESTGMKVLSSHTTKQLSKEELQSGDFTQSLKWWDEAIDAHKSAGMTYIVTPWMETPKNLKDLKTYCDYYNEVGKRCNEKGLKYGYHNHAHEFTKVEGQTVLDYMIENTKPENVFFQADVYWVVMGQGSPIDYFNKYPGRFTVLHLKDRRELGQSGMVGFDAILNSLKIAGTKDLVVEVEKYSFDVDKSIKQSFDYLKSIMAK